MELIREGASFYKNSGKLTTVFNLSETPKVTLQILIWLVELSLCASMIWMVELTPMNEVNRSFIL